MKATGKTKEMRQFCLKLGACGTVDSAHGKVGTRIYTRGHDLMYTSMRKLLPLHRSFHCCSSVITDRSKVQQGGRRGGRWEKDFAVYAAKQGTIGL